MTDPKPSPPYYNFSQQLLYRYDLFIFYVEIQLLIHFEIMFIVYKFSCIGTTTTAFLNLFSLLTSVVKEFFNPKRGFNCLFVKMTLVEFFGCTFLAFGPPFAMFVFTIAIDPIRIIILFASSFFWLLSLLLSSLFWLIIPNEHLSIGLFLSVLLQELFRFILFKVLKSAEGGLKKITVDETQLIENKHTLAYVAGLGFGIMSGLFSLINVLADSVGPGTMGLIQGSEKFFMTSAATTLCFILLHTFWGIIFFSAVDCKNYLYFVWVVISHLVVSGLTFLNQKELYVASILPAYVIMVLTGLIAFKIVGGSFASFMASLKIHDPIK